MSPTKGEGDIQSNLVNLKASGLEVLFRIISGMNYSEVDIKIHDRPKMIFISFFSTITYVLSMFLLQGQNICYLQIVIEIDHK